jgi:Rrf2 family protein
MAVHVLAVLAYKEGDRVTSAALAGSINTNPVIIRRLLLALQKGGLIDTCRGAGAGSRLSRSPKRINLAEIYRSVEDCESFAAPKRKPNNDCPVGHCILSALDTIFTSAQGAMERDLAKTTLADVIDRVKASGVCSKKQSA